MSVTRLIVPGAPIELGRLAVPPEAAHHARVARVAAGDAVEVLDLAGTIGVGRLDRWTGKSCVVTIEELVLGRGEPPAELVLALGVLQGDTFSWAVEKATELGATTVIPMLSRRVQGRRHDQRVERWRRVAESAVSQCGRARVPSIAEPTPFGDVIARVGGARVLADWDGTGVALDRHDAVEGITVMVGPEGGLTEEEREAAQAAGFLPLALGPRTLRAETAAVAALAVAQRLAGWPGY